MTEAAKKRCEELCRETIDLATKAEKDKGLHTWESYQRAHGNNFFNFAFVNIKSIAEHALALEAENKKLREVIQFAVDHLSSMDDYSIVNGAIYRLREALSSGGE